MASRAPIPESNPVTVSDPDFQSKPSQSGEDAVAALAYELWQQRGSPIGSDQEDWFRAESELKNRQRQPRESGAAGRGVRLNRA